MHRMPLAFFFFLTMLQLQYTLKIYKLQIFPLLKIIERKLMTLFKTEGKANYCNMGFRSGTDNIYQASNNYTVEIKKNNKIFLLSCKNSEVVIT